MQEQCQWLYVLVEPIFYHQADEVLLFQLYYISAVCSRHTCIHYAVVNAHMHALHPQTLKHPHYMYITATANV